jgi:hypothetical protein
MRKIETMRLIVHLALIFALSGCSYTFLPLTPAPLALEPRLVLGRAELTRSGADILLRLEFQKIPTEGYLSVKLERNDDPVTEDSKLISVNTQSLEWKLTDAVLGRYRAYLFWQGNVVRALDFVLEK